MQSLDQSTSWFLTLLQKKHESYLFQTTAFGPHKGQRVVLVHVGDNRCHFVIGFGEQWNSTNHLRDTEWGVHIQTTEVVIDGEKLERRTINDV